MAPSRQGRRIAIVGASGNIGTTTVNALIAHGIHTITAIARAESKSTFPSEVTVKKGALDDEDFLTEALKGQDVLVIQLGIDAVSLQHHLISAAAKAGVKWVLPCEFGSDIYAEEFIKRFPFLPQKREMRQYIEKLGVSSWIAVINNPWLDYCLPLGVFGIDIGKKTAQLWDGGNTKMNTATMRRVVEATAELLALPEEELAKYRNEAYYLTSFYVTQRELFESVLRATGATEADWDVSTPDSEQTIKETTEKMAAAGGFDVFAFQTQFMVSHFQSGLGGDFNDKVEDLERFGLAKEDLDEEVRAIVKKLEQKP